jgi:hypothetical protein
MSYAPEVQTDGTTKWYGNALRFATEQEAIDNVRDLEIRWMAVQGTRVVESPDPVNYSYANRQLVRIEAANA